MKNRKKEIALDLSARIYREEAVRLAAHVLSRRARFFLEKGKAKMSVCIQGKGAVSGRDLGSLAGDFLNEVLNQECRLDLAKANSRLQQMILARALASARPKDEGKAGSGDAEALRRLEKDAQLMMEEARKEISLSSGEGAK